MLGSVYHVTQTRSVPIVTRGPDLPRRCWGDGGTGFYRFPCTGSGRSGTVSGRATPSAPAPSPRDPCSSHREIPAVVFHVEHSAVFGLGFPFPLTPLRVVSGH